MELFLNLGWVLVAAVLVNHWLRRGKFVHADRRLSFVSLVMLIAILFPVISISDDLWSLHNPAETDVLQRRDQATSSSHSIFPVTPVLPELADAELNFVFLGGVENSRSDHKGMTNPAIHPIENRPPPGA
jgi:hypothetical protein